MFHHLASYLQNLASHLTAADLLKDGVLSTPGVSLAALFANPTAVVFGVLNILVVIIFRLIELRRRTRSDLQIEHLLARIAELEAEKRAGK